jgi:ribonuclease HII
MPVTGEELILEWRRRSHAKSPHEKLPIHLGLSHGKMDRWRCHPAKYIIGADEVGSGCLAGPVVVCAFMSDGDWRREGLRDSKKHTARAREALYPELITSGLGYHVAELPNTWIDRFGMGMCLKLLYEECIEQLRERFPEKFEESLIVFDGTVQARHVDHAALPKGDDIVRQISAASVIAKVTRDRWMTDVADRLYPQYGFAEHMGYGTDVHRAAIVEYGVTPIHRRKYLKNLQKWVIECS